MIKQLLSRQGYLRGRIWIDELPDAKYPPLTTLRKQLSIVRSPKPLLTKLAIELYRPVGGRAYYALLGAVFIADSQNILIEVDVCKNERRYLDWALASKMSRVFAGLPYDEARVVTNVLASSIQSKGFHPGTLHIGCAAYSETGSNREIFGRLAERIVVLFMADLTSLDDSELSSTILGSPGAR